MPANFALPLAGCLSAAAAATAAGLFLAGSLTRPRPRHPALEEERRARLRRGDYFYRWLEPLVDALARRTADGPRREAIALSLRLAAESLPWTAAEHQVIAGLKASALGLLLALAAVVAPVLIVLAPLVAAAGYFLRLRDLEGRARRRRAALKARLPFTAELLALQVEAGAPLLEALNSVAAAQAGHPLGEELGAIVRAVRGGRPFAEALAAAGHLRHDEDLARLLDTLGQADGIGAGPAPALRALARWLLGRASLLADQAAAEARVAMELPVFLVMIACLLAIAAPFVLDALAHF